MLDTPVVLVAFRRPGVTRMVLEAIREAGARQFFIIADGPRQGNLAEEKLVYETRQILSTLDWECRVTRIYSDENLGLRERVLTGLDKVFSSVDRAIILEDDCLPHQDFFQFASELLERFENTNEVALISANNFAPNSKMADSYYFATHANIWGWATWRRTWQEFRSEPPPMPLGTELRKVIKSRLPGLFRSRGFLRLTDLAGKLDSWAIQFAASCHLKNKLVVVPKVNLARNIGFGQDSTHTKFESYADEVDTQPLGFPLTHPINVAASFPEMKRESRIKSLRWIIFPIMHPLNFLKRLWRYAKVLMSAALRK